MKNKIFFIGYDAIGDYMSYNGMIRTLSELYNEVTIVSSPQYFNFLTFLFGDNEKINFCIEESYKQHCNSKQNFDVLDARVWENYSKIGDFEGCYFSRNNKFGSYKNEFVNDNSSFFYEHLGFDSKMKINKFYYKRDVIKEKNLFDSLEVEPKSYIAICDYVGSEIKKETFADKKIINLHKISNDLLDIISIIENASETHLIENSISLLVYYLQSNNLMEHVDINLHAYSRPEKHRKANLQDYEERYNLSLIEDKYGSIDRASSGVGNFYLNMLLYPELKNWKIIW